MSNKDDLLTYIKQLETQREELLAKHSTEQEELKVALPNFEAIKKAYDEVKAQFDQAEHFLREKRNSIADTIKDGKAVKDDLDAAKRELGRLLDAEKIDEAYIREVETFRARCLASSWRKENREDGYGAYRHQVEGAIHLAVTKQCLLGDKRGLGKTCTAAAFFDLVESERTIVICPPDLVDNFIRELELWVPHRFRTTWKLAEMNPNQRDLLLPLIKEQPQFTVVLSYSSWRRDTRLIPDLIELKPDAICWDEAHHAKTWDTVTCRGIRDLRFGVNQCPGCDNPKVNPVGQSDVYSLCDNCGYQGVKSEFSTVKYVVPMTGTAIMNKPQELFPHMHMVDPVNFPNEKAFLRDFCMQDMNTKRWKWQWGGQKRCLEKIGPRYLSRSKEDTDVVIPPYQNIEHLIPMAEMQEFYPKQWKAYEQGRKYAQIVLDPERKTVMTMVNKLAVLMRLRQILVWPAGIELWDRWTDEDDVKHEEFIGRLEVEESIKIDKAIDEIIQAHEEGERTVLFSMFRPGLHVMRDRLSAKGLRIAVYDGSATRVEKGQIERDFDPKYAPDHPLFDAVLCNYKSASEGLNFNTATNEILLDRHWHNAGEDQAGGRINRIGTRRDSTIHKLMVDKSADTYMRGIIDEKLDVTDSFESQARLLQGAYDAILRGEM